MATEEALRVSVIMGSDSDRSTVRHAEQALRDYGLVENVDYESRIISAHRTEEEMRDHAHSAEERGLQVVIPFAGGSAHLQGMTASMTTLPEAGVAVTSHPAVMNRALGSCIGMPEGKPLATFQAAGGAYNAGKHAVQILGSVAKEKTRVGIITSMLTDSDETMSHAARALRRLGLEDGTDFEEFSFSNVLQAAIFVEDRGADEFSSLIVSSTGGNNMLGQLLAGNETPMLGVAITDNPDVMSPGLNAIVNRPEGEAIAAFQAKAGAFNAGLQAARILAINNPEIRWQIQAYNNELRVENKAKDQVLKRLGGMAYDELSKEELADLVADEIPAMWAEIGVKT